MNKNFKANDAPDVSAINLEELRNSISAGDLADEPIDHLAIAVAKNSSFPLKINSDIQHGIVDGTRVIVNIHALMEQLKNPRDAAGAPVDIHTREDYEIYRCLKIMPHCIKSMEITRGDKGGKIGNNRPLENTICVTIHHIDDKSYGGLCVLREWGATDMMNIFVGYNPLQTMIWRDMISDIPDELFTACILESTPVRENAPSWAEGIYRVVREFNKFPQTPQLPSEAFDRIFDGTNADKNPSGKPLTFLGAQRCLSAYNFLQALARGHKENKQVFVWEDGGYLNPIIDQAIQDKLTVSEFRKLYMLPDDEATDKLLPKNFVDAVKDIFIGSVELTRNGYDMSAAISQTRPMNTNFFAISASYEKIMLEGDSIVLACLDALSQVLYSTGYSLRNRNVFVLGARGNLGRLCVKHLASILEAPKNQLWGCDLKLDWPKPKPGSIPKWAEWSACDVPLEDVGGEIVSYKQLPEDVKYSFDVIFGWTGGPRKRIVGGKEIVYQTIDGQDIADWLTIGEEKSSLYLVSGSTKTAEFSAVLLWLESILSKKPEERIVSGILLDELVAGPIPDQLSIAAVTQMWPDENPPTVIKRNFGTQFTFVFKQKGVKITKTIYLVNNTMPINFMYYGTPTEIMDMTYSQVTSCAVALMKHKNGAPGVYPTDYSKKATDDVYLGQDLDKEYDIPLSI